MKWGALVTDGRGKIGGHVASKNRAGAYLRTKVTPVNPATSFQAAVRSFFASLSQGWRALTGSEIIAWNSAVQNFSTTDIFGDLRNPTGKNLYQKLNTNLNTVGASGITVPPLPVGGGAVADFTLTVAETAQVFDVELGANAVPAGKAWVVEATPAITPGISFVKNQYRVLGVFAATVTGTRHLGTAYTARFGPIVEGQQYFVRIKSIDILTGESGTPKVSKADAGA